jgi:PKD domain-containing protein
MSTGREPPRSARIPPRPRAHRNWVVPLSVLGIVILAVAALGVGSSATIRPLLQSGSAPSVGPEVVGTHSLLGPILTQHLQAIRPGAALSVPTPVGPRAVPVPGIAWLNGSQCDPNWPSMPIGLSLIEATINWTGAVSGGSPLNFSWAIAIHGGGIPPYQVVVDFQSLVGTSFDANFTTLNGSFSLMIPGMYFAVAQVVDSSCDAVAASYLGPITVYGPSGRNPVQLSPSVSSGPAPLAVQYSENLSGVGPNDTLTWQSPFSWTGGGWSINTTYYSAGNFSASACLLNAVTGVWLACGDSPSVTVNGSILTTGVAIGNGTLPVNITYWVNVTNTSALPSNWTVDLSVNNGSSFLITSQNASTSGTASFGCGPTNPTNPPAADGVCTWAADYLVTASPNGTAVYVAKGVVWANITENGSPVQWYPTVTYTESATNGTIPFNVTINVSASNGLAPYQYWWAVFGASSAAANRTFYPTLSGNGSGWNGTSLNLSFHFVLNGIYLITLTVGDSDHNRVFLYPPVLAVGVPLGHRPLHLSAGTLSVNAGRAGLSLAQFVANVSGGTLPYTLQWQFGDGTYGSSIPGVAVDHTFRSAGSFLPTVTVTDQSGNTSTVALAPVNVTAASAGTGGNHSGRGTTGPSGPSGPSTGGGGTIAGPFVPPPVGLASVAVGIVALALVGAFVYRTERNRSAEVFVSRLEADAEHDRDRPPSAP